MATASFVLVLMRCHECVFTENAAGTGDTRITTFPKLVLAHFTNERPLSASTDAPVPDNQNPKGVFAFMRQGERHEVERRAELAVEAVHLPGATHGIWHPVAPIPGPGPCLRASGFRLRLLRALAICVPKVSEEPERPFLESGDAQNCSPT